MQRLSLRDMNRSADLEAMMDAGVSSFKIEGRLKDVAYVKNVTAYYRQRIDSILRRRPADFCRASYGKTTLTFTPNLDKSFNRRFTDYFLHRRNPDLACLATPKAIGEPVGTVKDVASGRSLAIAGTASFANGDGLCFIDSDGRLQGFRVNRVDDHGRIFPADPSVLLKLRKGQRLFRNLDAAFERQLARPTAERRLSVSWTISDEPDDGFSLTMRSEDGRLVTRTFSYAHEQARTPQAPNIRKQLMRLGETVYSTCEADISIQFADNWFIPASLLADWRRCLTEALSSLTPANLIDDSSLVGQKSINLSVGEETRLSLLHTTPLMTCRYCLRYELGECLSGKNNLEEHKVTDINSSGHKAAAFNPSGQLALRLADGRTFPLRFDCRSCTMLVLRPDES